MKHKLASLVPHPRYGVAVRPSACEVPAEIVRASYYGYAQATIFPESAIEADTSLQNYSVVPRGYYVDILKQCRDCGRGFLFFAEEQRYWYEELKFYIDADCVRCCECRRHDQLFHMQLQKYSELISVLNLSDEQLALLVNAAIFLWRHGTLKNELQLRRLKNLANQQIPAQSATREILKLIAELE